MNFNSINNFDGFQLLAPYSDTIFDKPSPLCNEEYQLFEKYVGQLGISGNKYLDIGCGTGDLCFYMANIGYSVTGMDFSDNMLMVARNKLALFKKAIENRSSIAKNPLHSNAKDSNLMTSVKPSLKFIKNDITVLNDIKEKYNLISALNILSYLSPPNLLISIKNFFDLLHNNGHLIFNLITPVEFETVHNKNVKNDNFDYSINYNYDKNNKIQTTRYHFNTSAIINESLTIDFVEYEHQLANILKVLSDNNFIVTKIIPDTPVFSINDSDLNYICDAIESSFSMPNGVRNIIIAANKQ